VGTDDLRDLVERMSRRLDAQDAPSAEQSEVIERQAARIDELESRLRRDSRTSSRPPSSDPSWSKKRRRRKPASDKSQGAQPGHPGATRDLVDESEVDDVQDHRPSECSACGSDALLASDRRPTRQQVFEIPPRLIHVTEHRLHRALCTACGATTTTALPEGVTASPFGPRLSALTAALVGVFRLSRRETSRLLRDVIGVSMSPGTVSAIEERVSGALSSAHIEALGAVRTSQVAYVDETPWSRCGTLHWLWSGVCAHATVHRIDRRRSAKAMRKLIGRRYRGVLVTDRMGAYDQHPTERRQICWAHLERDFRALAEGPRGGRRFGKTAVGLAQAVMRAHRRFGEHQDRARMQRELRKTWDQLLSLLVRGADSNQRRVRGTSRHLLDRADALWTFADVPGVAPTNNTAERAVRKPVLWRRGSHGSQSERGLRFVERILTVTATLRQRGDNVFDYLTAATNAAVRGQPPPTLVALPITR